MLLRQGKAASARDSPPLVALFGGPSVEHLIAMLAVLASG